MEFKIKVFRDVLKYLEKNLSYDKRIDSNEIKIEDYSPDDIAYHIEMLNDAGFIKADDLTSFGDKYKDYLVERLTYSGHEFLAAIKSDTVWNKMLEGAGMVGIEVIKSTIPILLTYAKSQLGIT